MKKVLLLNSDCTPLNFVTVVRAFNLILKGRAEVIKLGERQSSWDIKIKTTSDSFEVPATLRMVEKVNRKFGSAPKFRKRVLFNRDSWTCQYCGIKLDASNITIDHIMPRARGGQTNWRNCVTSCKKCNIKKGARLLPETGMQLRKNPIEPSMLHFWEAGVYTWHPDWSYFLPRR
jgi:5-methylcytosine-specific restriction endonuclease McrA